MVINTMYNHAKIQIKMQVTADFAPNSALADPECTECRVPDLQFCLEGGVIIRNKGATELLVYVLQFASPTQPGAVQVWRGTCTGGPATGEPRELRTDRNFFEGIAPEMIGRDITDFVPAIQSNPAGALLHLYRTRSTPQTAVGHMLAAAIPADEIPEICDLLNRYYTEQENAIVAARSRGAEQSPRREVKQWEEVQVGEGDRL